MLNPILIEMCILIEKICHDIAALDTVISYIALSREDANEKRFRLYYFSIRAVRGTAGPIGHENDRLNADISHRHCDSTKRHDET